MMISELFVRVRADVADVNRRMREIEGALGGVDRASKSAGLQTGRLGNQFAGLAGQITRVHPIVGNLAGVLGNFAIGAGLTVGVLAGVAAVAVAYDKLTESSRKAMAAADKLSESYNRAARIAALGIGGQQLSDIETINKGLEQHNKWLGFIIAARIQLGALGGLFGKDPGGHGAAITAGTTAAARAEQERVNAIGLREAANNEKWAARQKEIADKAMAAAKKAQQDFLAGITSGIAVFDNMAAHGTSSSVVNQKLIDDYGKLAAQIRQMGDASTPAAAELLKLRDALMANLVVAQAVGAANATGTVGPLVGKTLPGMSITGHAADPNKPMAKVGSPSDPIVEATDHVQLQLKKDAEDQAREAQAIQNAIYQSANIISNSVMGALNVGGGGKGSQIGGQLGAIAGGVGGSMLGPPGAWFGGIVGSAFGSVVGGVLGSAIGGLFDSHKKEVNANTQALRQNTAALMLNAPNVYKVAQGRFAATEIKNFRRAAVNYSTRGGAPITVRP